MGGCRAVGEHDWVPIITLAACVAWGHGRCRQRLGGGGGRKGRHSMHHTCTGLPSMLDWCHRCFSRWWRHDCVLRVWGSCEEAKEALAVGTGAVVTGDEVDEQWAVRSMLDLCWLIVCTSEGSCPAPMHAALSDGLAGGLLVQVGCFVTGEQVFFHERGAPHDREYDHYGGWCGPRHHHPVHHPCRPRWPDVAARLVFRPRHRAEAHTSAVGPPGRTSILRSASGPTEARLPPPRR
jgi:hypothetical protein